MFKKVVYISNRFFLVTKGFFSFKKVVLRLNKFFIVGKIFFFV